MKKIESITSEQEAKIPEFHQKWLDMVTKPMDFDVAVDSINKIYKRMEQNDSPAVIVGKSPKHTQRLAAVFWMKFADNIESADEIQDLQTVLELAVENTPVEELDKFYANNLKEDWYLGLWWLVWCAWYDFGQYIGVEFDKDIFDLFMNYSSNVHFIMPYEGIAFVSEKLVECHWENDKLHADGKMSYKYADGYGGYTLNGVPVPEYLAMTPEEDLDIEFFNNTKDADVRTEFLRKYGIERMIDHGKLVDTYQNYDNEWFNKSQYELYDMAKLFEGVEYAPHLKMTNLTTGVYHVEAVGPNCRTIEDAVKDRFGGKALNIINIA